MRNSINRFLFSMSLFTMIGNCMINNCQTGYAFDDRCGTISNNITAYVETEVTGEEFDKNDYEAEITYTDSAGNNYQLPYKDYEILNEGWHSGYYFEGYIENYDASSYEINGKEYTAIKDGLTTEQMQDILLEFGYGPEKYRPTGFSFQGAPYEINGILYRDFKIDYELYGCQYRVNYELETDNTVQQAESISGQQENTEKEVEILDTQQESTEKEDEISDAQQESTEKEDEISDAQQDEVIQEENKREQEKIMQEEIPKETMEIDQQKYTDMKEDSVGIVITIFVLIIIFGIGIVLFRYNKKT